MKKIFGSLSAIVRNVFVEFSPKEPLFASGSTMQLNGTLILRNATPGVTAHQVHCTFDDANLTVDVLDNVTFQIRHENVTRQMSHGHVFCYVGRTMKLPQVVIRVAGILFHYNQSADQYSRVHEI